MPDAIRLVTLPLRIGVRAVELVLDPVLDAAKHVLGRNGEEPEVEWSRPSAARPDPAAGEAPGGAAAVAEAGPAADAEPAAEAEPGLRENEPGGAPDADPPSALAEPVAEADESGEPEHVSTEATLVAESADPEIADGIHADLHVAEPWDGYRTQNAAEVIEALKTASPAQIGVVQLYESTHRRRKTVLEAAERALRESAS